MNETQGRLIASLMAELHPKWDAPGCFAAVAKLAHLNAADVAMAAIRLTQMADVKTPAALTNTTGPQWRERVSERGAKFPPRRGEDCPAHPGQWPDNCSGCAADRATGEQAKPSLKRPEMRTPANEDFRRARDELKRKQSPTSH